MQVWQKIFQFFLVLLATLSCTTPQQLVTENVQRRDLNFEHYTFAVSWLPGLCQSGEIDQKSCALQKKKWVAPYRWSLHGLWPSLPEELKNKIDLETWWKDGCFWYEHRSPGAFCNNPAVQLDTSTEQALSPIMPGMAVCLERHEYYKHAACFNMEPNTYFRLSANLVYRFNKTKFADFIREHRGQQVAKAKLRQIFADTFGKGAEGALEIRCSLKPSAPDVLVEIWMAIPRDKIDLFPASESFMDWKDGNCPEKIWIAK